jgi:hypothetical protein
MRSSTGCIVSGPEVHRWCLDWLTRACLLKDRGWKCTVPVVLSVVLRAATRSISVSAACRDLSGAPSDRALLGALQEGLPKSLPSLERRLNDALTGSLPRRMRRRGWQVAIDWHLVPYYGQPFASRNELYYGRPRQGTKKFHAYATACVVEHGRRYTLALTWVRRHESTTTVLRRLVGQIRVVLGLKIKCLLLDRAFFSVPVVRLLQQEGLPFLMPVMFRGRRPKKGTPPRGLRALRRKAAGWHTHTMNSRDGQATVRVVVGYRTHKNRKDKRRVQQKLLFAAWRVGGSPTQVRERYRKRFGIEASYRQMRQARIPTCTRNPRLRLFFIAVALMLRNVWVWVHQTKLAEGTPDNPKLQLQALRFRRMLDWIAEAVRDLIHDKSTPCVNTAIT